MQTSWIRIALCVVCLLTSFMVKAAERIPIEDFARHPVLSMPRLSPDGQYLAVRMDGDDDNHALVIFRIGDMSRPTSILRMPKYEVPANFEWVSPTRLIVEKGKLFGSIDKPSLTGEIIATDIDGKHQDYLYGYKAGYGSRSDTRARDHGWGFYDGRPEPANGHFYLSTQSWDSENQSSLYDVNANQNVRHLIGDIGVAGMHFMVGVDGKAHYAYGHNNDYQYVVYHGDGSAWTKLSAAQIGGSFAPIDVAPDHQHIYASYAAGGGPTSLVEQNEDGSDRVTLAAAGFGSVGEVEWTALPQQPFASAPSTGLPRVRYIDPNLPAAKLHMALSLKFPGSYVHFIDYSEDGGELLFGVSSDRTPGAYYLINTHTYKVNKLFDAAPWIDPAAMAERKSFHFKASDGTELEAILTLPKGADAFNLPMVLLPHGGPIGIQDNWFFDDDAQFLASRGYLVLQVNYRGSSGRGANFEEAAYLKWGTRVQQDLIDGVKWAIDQKYADPKRICVYGGSFGGYSAIMTTIRAPGMFRCAIGYAGIYDLSMMYSKGDIRESKSGRSYLTQVIGKNQADLDANSPDKLADKITVPVFLIHGEDDQRAPFAQAKAMRTALEAAHKPYEWLAKPGEGHGFYDVKNRIELYQRIQAFLEKNIGPGV